MIPLLGPLALRLAPYAALAVAGLVIWGLWGQLGTAKLELANAKAVIAVREDDAKRSAIAIAKLADTLNKTETKVITQVERIYAAPITRECAQSPSMRAASDGLRELFGVGDKADPGRNAAPTVPAPAVRAGNTNR